MTSNPTNRFCAVLLCNFQCWMHYHQGKGHRFMTGGRLSAICRENLDHSLLLFPVMLAHSIPLYKPYVCRIHVHSGSSWCSMLKAMSQWEWVSIHAACYHWTVLLSAGTVWLQEHFKEPVRRRRKPVKWDTRSQRAALQRLNDVEASSSVRQ